MTGIRRFFTAKSVLISGVCVTTLLAALIIGIVAGETVHAEHIHTTSSSVLDKMDGSDSQGKNTLVGMEDRCYQRLQNASGSTARQKINNSIPYDHHEWVSRYNNPSASNIFAGSNEDVELQVNSMAFYCAIVVENSQVKPGTQRDGVAVISQSNFPRDRHPITYSSGSNNNNEASYSARYTRIKEIRKTQGSGRVKNYQQDYTFGTNRQSTRYSFVDPAPFTYNTGNLGDSEIVEIRVKAKRIVEFHGNDHYCQSPQGRSVSGPNDFGPCDSLSVTLRFQAIKEEETSQNIRGLKDAKQGVQQSDIDNNRVKLDGGNKSTTSNPFRFEPVSPGNHSVSVNTGGYDVSYEYCRNNNVGNCDPGSLQSGAGNSFTVNVPEDGFVDVRFYFRDGGSGGGDGSSAIRGKKVNGNHQPDSSEPWYNNLVTVQGGSEYRSTTGNPFGFTSLDPNTYTVSVSSEPDYEVRWVYCRSVESGDREMVNKVKDDGSCEFDNGSRTSGTGSSFSVRTHDEEQIYVHFIFEEVLEAELETNTKGNHKVAAPGDSVSIGAYVKNVGDAESEPVNLRVRAVSGSNRISPNRRTKNVGTLEPGDREDRSFRFNVRGNAQDGDKICFKSRAKESGKSWVNGNRQVCVGVVRNFDMRTRVYAPNSPEDELTGPFRVTGVARNHRNRNQDGMKTQGHNYIEVSLSVESGRQYVKHLYNGSSDKVGSPSRTQPYKLTWEYSGFGNEFFHAQPTPDHDKVRAWTEVKKDAVEGIKEVCFKVKAKPRYRHKNIFQSYSGWGSIDTYGSYSRTDCTDLWEVRVPYVTTEDGDVHGGSVVVNPETANQQCQNDNANVEGRTSSGSTIGSKSTYAVSATGRINNFGSNNSTNDGRLKFGNQPPSGNYQAICRPDLTNLNYYKKLGYDITQDNRPNIRPIINQINNESGKYSDGDEFVVRLTHPNPRVQGNNVTLERGKHVTFIAENRDFDIRSDVRMEGGSRNNVNDIPALAIIAGGDIDIYKDVGNIQAYISSNGTVDTCGNVADITQQNQAPRCEDWLRIRGALIAKRIEFRRTSGHVGHSGPAEIIVYAPELSLSPPPGTMGLTNNIFFGRPLWERLPFF